MGNGQCIYTYNDLKISMIYPCSFTHNTFEIYCLKGDIFYDIERYYSEAEAEERIKELFNIVEEPS